jgi:hypothetical protein
VIENEQTFPRTFALDIIAGKLVYNTNKLVLLLVDNTIKLVPLLVDNTTKPVPCW